MSFLDSNALSESRDILLKCIYIIENNFFPKLKLFCEPMLSKRNLYPKFGGAIKSDKTKLIKNLIAYSDGKLDLIDLCELFDVDFTEICKTSNVLVENNLLSKKLI